MDYPDEQPHVFPQARRPGDKLFAVGFFIVCLALLSQMFWQTQWLPGKGFAAQPRTWPLIGLGGATVFGLLHLVQVSRLERTPGRWREARRWASSLEYVLWYLLYVFSIPIIGYLIATLAFCAFLTWRTGYRGRLATYAALAFGLSVVLFFKTFLHVKIPGGMIYEYLPSALRNVMILSF